ncbi:MAG: alpha/beta hydrolase [Xanthomonadales bacterium]|nr:alpha/beta hydrolase [Xanthomonadales bacterium]
MSTCLDETSKLSSRPLPLALHWLAACMLAVMMAPMPATGADTPDTTLAFAAYEFQTEGHGTFDAEVAFLEVPRRRDRADGPRLKLRVVRLPATGGDASAAPVVYLAGGPGGSGVGTARGPHWPVFDQVRRETDVLLFDQRGTGLSEPPPACPHSARFDDGRPLQREVALAALSDTAARCIAHWRDEGVDLAAYTSAESAADLDDLRRALGVPKISLWGMSYGSHLALASLRLHAAGIERVVLIGVEGPDHTLKLPLAADTLLADLSVFAREQGFDDLTDMTGRVLARLRQEPGQGRSLMHRGREVTLGAFDAQLAIAAALGRRSTQQMLPLSLRTADQGDYDLLATLVLAVRDQLGQFRAMPLAMELASGHSPHRRALAQAQAHDSLFGDALNFPFPMIGDGLGLIDLGEAFRAPLHSDVPALLVSGTLDGRTPPANAQALLPGFSAAAHLRVANASHDHELWLGNPDIAAHIAGFLAGRQVSDAELDVAPPVMVQGKLALLMQTLGISRAMLWGAVGLLAALVLAAVALIKRRRRARIHHSASGSR